MRNKKLLMLQMAAEHNFAKLTEYLRHLDSRETDPSYVHARMLFDEGWRIRNTKSFIHSEALDGGNFVLWMDAEEGEESPACFGSREINSKTLLEAMQLTNIESSTSVLQFLVELTDEIGVNVPTDVEIKVLHSGKDDGPKTT